MRKLLSEDDYTLRRKQFRENCGPSASQGFFGEWAWSIKHMKKFDEQLLAENTWHETDVNDDYIALRDSTLVRDFFETDPSSISRADFEALAINATKQAFGDKSYLNSIHRRAEEAFLERARDTLMRVFSDRGISIVSR